MNENYTPNISAQQAHQLLTAPTSEFVLLDVRTAAEYEAAHAAMAQNIPLHTITAQTAVDYKDKKVICICQKGGRGATAAALLSKNGLSTVSNIEGGTEAWEKAALPLIRGKSTISLERQVRIAAGALVCLGVIGGFFVHQHAILLSLFVGLGLVFSGITDTCGMALLLGQCPWNSKK